MVVWECQVMADPQKVQRRLVAHLERLAGKPARVAYPDVDRGALLKLAEARLNYELAKRPRKSEGGV